MTEAKFLEMIYNWDHEICPTSIADMEKNLAHYLEVTRNYAQVRVMLNRDMLVIQHLASATFGRGQSFGRACDPYWDTVVAVIFDSHLPREAIGRLGHHLPVGLYKFADIVRDAA
jgi:hypothetical protein